MFNGKPVTQDAKSLHKKAYYKALLPPRPFAETRDPKPPDYTDHGPRSWSAFPGRKNNSAEVRPKGEAGFIPEADRPVDCFYLNPTTYGIFTGRKYYNASLKEYCANVGVDVFLAAQASCFNPLCRIYAPRYRQAHLLTIFYGPVENRMHALEMAYEDVKKAFEHFISELSGDRPFIVAGHSQGARLACRLLADCVEGTPLMKRFIAGYLLGGGISLPLIKRDFQQIHLCEGPLDTGCIMGWDAVPEGFKEEKHFWAADAAGQLNYSVKDGCYSLFDDEDWLVTNPLTWVSTRSPALDGEGKEEQREAEHLGVQGFIHGLSLRHKFSYCITSLGRPRKLGPGFKLETTRKFVVTSNVTSHAGEGRPSVIYRIKLFSGTYHMQDLSLFYHNVRENAKDRIAAFLEKREQAV